MSRVLPGLAEAIAAQGPGLYVDHPAPDDYVDVEPDVCDECGGSGLNCSDDICSGACERCGGLGYLP